MILSAKRRYTLTNAQCEYILEYLLRKFDNAFTNTQFSKNNMYIVVAMDKKGFLSVFTGKEYYQLEKELSENSNEYKIALNEEEVFKLFYHTTSVLRKEHTTKSSLYKEFSTLIKNMVYKNVNKIRYT